MKKTHFLSFTFLVVVMLIPASAFAQKSAADKSWNTFWTQFTSAVNKKSKPAVKRLMASEKDFSSGGGMEDRDGWLQLVDKQRWWDDLQRDVKSGTKSYDYDGKPGRVTRNNTLIFAFIGGRWRFMGPMGD